MTRPRDVVRDRRRRIERVRVPALRLLRRAAARELAPSLGYGAQVHLVLPNPGEAAKRSRADGDVDRGRQVGPEQHGCGCQIENDESCRGAGRKRRLGNLHFVSPDVG
jgi:hypothetical protein